MLMGRYENAREWVLRKARVLHMCDSCRRDVAPGEQYFAEQLMFRLNKPPGLQLGKLCRDCGSAVLVPSGGTGGSAP